MPDSMRVPPQNIEAEQAVLCACLIRPELIPQIRAILSIGDYYREAHNYIAETLYVLGNAATVITLQDALQRAGHLEQCGGMDYLCALVDTVSTSAGWRYHADLILEASRRRQVINAASVAQDQAYTGDLGEVTTTLRDRIAELEPRPVQETNLQTLQRIVEQAGDKTPREGIETGFPSLDMELGKIEPAWSVYLAGRTSTGKTALTLAIVRNLLKSSRGTTLIYSLDMPRPALLRRMLSSESDIALSAIRHGDVRGDGWNLIQQASERIADRDLLIYDDPDFSTVERLVGHSEAILKDRPINLVVVDHIQCLQANRRTQSRHHEVSFISRYLRDFCRGHRVPLFVLCQLKRVGDSNARPSLNDLKESGDLENNAALVLGLWRKDKRDDTLEIECLKYQDGPAGWTVKLTFNRFTQSFRDMGRVDGVLPYGATEV